MFGKNENDDKRKDWAPDARKVKDIESEIKSSFDYGSKSVFDNPTEVVRPEMPEQSFINECAKIGAFLMDEQAVISQLEKLNAILVDKIDKGADPDDVHLLRNTLEEELGKLGFHPNLGKAMEFVQPEIFRAAILNGLLLKDPTLGNKAHGEFTHALQWLMIAWQQQDNEKFLGKPAVEVFKQLGDEKSVFSRTPPEKNSPIDSPREEKGIWDIIADELDSQYSGFRSPEKLHIFLIGENIKSLSALQHLILNRVKKREKTRVYNKYSNTNLESSTMFSRKNDRETYQHSIPKVLTPKNINIDLENFKNQSSKTKK